MATLSDLTGGEKTITLADITGKFSTRTQRQDYYETQKEETVGAGANIYDPYNETTAADYSGNWDEEQGERAVSPERAARTGRQIAKVIDTGFNFFASKFIAHSNKEYKADPSDLEDIAEAWGEIAHEKQWEVSPYLQLTILYLIVYAPLAKQALADRQIQELANKQDSQAEQIKALENELARLKESAKAQDQA